MHPYERLQAQLLDLHEPGISPEEYCSRYKKNRRVEKKMAACKKSYYAYLDSISMDDPVETLTSWCLWGIVLLLIWVTFFG